MTRRSIACSSLLSSLKSLGGVPRTRAKGRRMGWAESNAARAVAPGNAAPKQRASPNQDGDEDDEAVEASSQHQRQRGAIARAMERAAHKIHRWKQGSPDPLISPQASLTAPADPAKPQTPAKELSCRTSSALEATQGQMDSFVSQLPYKRHLEEAASV